MHALRREIYGQFLVLERKIVIRLHFDADTRRLLVKVIDGRLQQGLEGLIVQGSSLAGSGREL